MPWIPGTPSAIPGPAAANPTPSELVGPADALERAQRLAAGAAQQLRALEESSAMRIAALEAQLLQANQELRQANQRQHQTSQQLQRSSQALQQAQEGQRQLAERLRLANERADAVLREQRSGRERLDKARGALAIACLLLRRRYMRLRWPHGTTPDRRRPSAIAVRVLSMIGHVRVCRACGRGRRAPGYAADPPRGSLYAERPRRAERLA